MTTTIQTRSPVTRTLIDFHPRELFNNSKLLKDVVDDYLGFYWSIFKDAGTDVIQERLLGYTQVSVPLDYIKGRKSFMSNYLGMEKRNDKHRKSENR